MTLAASATVTSDDIRSAHARIRGHIRRTPILETASPIAGAPPLSLKLECLQVTGSFKARCAFHNLLTRPAPAAGCATASGGNHGAAVAFAAQKLGIRARIFVPDIATPAKIAKIKAYGAQAMIGGGTYAEAHQRCDQYVAETGALSIHPYDAIETIAGQGSAALEWEEDLERLGLLKLDTVLIAVGGGGLIAGAAAWFDDPSRWLASSRRVRARFTRRSRRTRRSTWPSSRSRPTHSAPSGWANSISRSPGNS